jgi:D-arabinose 1-dehydrogenase-like Zn-dependent alcohol dehydrogenase
MKAAVLEEFGKPLKVTKDWKDPECGPGDAVLKVEANGICRSDWHLWQGGWEWIGFVPPLPAVLGHEYCGVVEEVGSDVKRFKKGQRVVVPFHHSCGVCESCQSGHQNVCSDLQIPMFHYSGGFGQYAQVGRADVNLVPLPEEISFEAAASLGCRFMTAFHAMVHQAAVKPGEWVAVFGCGGVGLAAVEICTALGANVIAVSRGDKKLALAKELGAVHTVKAGDDAAEKIVELTGGGAHVSADALGIEATTLPAIACLRTRGRHVRIGMSGKEEKGQISLPVDVFVARELAFVGSFGMQAQRYPEMLRMVGAGQLHPEKLLEKKVPIEEASDVLASMSDFGTTGVAVINQF